MKEETMRRATTSIVTAGVVILMAISVRGDSPHYLRLSPSIDSQTFCYSAALKEAGLGTAESVTYTLTANATFTAQCFTRSGNPVEGTTKSGSGTATSFTTIQVHHGQTTGTVSLCPAAFNIAFPGCTGNQVQVLTGASYANVVLSDGLGGAGAGDQNLPSLSVP
jgi:hypothetical protein